MAAPSANAALEPVRTRIHREMLSRLDLNQLEKMAPDALRAELQWLAGQLMDELKIALNESERRQVIQGIQDEMLGLGPLEPLLADPGISDILVNGPQQTWIERRGKLERSAVRFDDDAHLRRVIDRIVSRIGRRVDEMSPMVDARLPDGSRVNAVIPPLAIDGASLSIRRFGGDALTLQELVRLQALTPGMAELIAALVQARLNVLVSGGTGSGKTTLLNAMSASIPASERIITIEDAAELQLQQPHVVRLESRPPNIEGEGEVSQRALLRNSLRMRPDRIIVGEVRSGEVLELLQAMNTGHDGSMGTIHASSPRECLYRAEMLAGFAGFQGSEVSLRRQIANAVDFIVQIGRLSNGRRRLLSLTEVTGMTDNVISMQELYRYEPQIGADGQEIDNWTSMGISPHSPKLLSWWRAQQQTGGMR